MNQASKKPPGKQKGDFGEARVAAYLRGQGYEIVCQNYRSPFGEIDVIATRGGIIAFVEVKTRRAGTAFPPAEAVGWAKRQRIISTAFVYLQNHPARLQPRFDVAQVLLGGYYGADCRIEYITNAFMQEGDYAAF